MKAIIGKKVGMSQIFDENGHVIPVTVIEAGPCVTQKKTTEKDGYEAVQLGYEDVAEKKLSKPEGPSQQGRRFPKKYLREFALDNGSELELGAVIKADMFQVGDFVDVTGTSKGHGYEGVVKRCGYAIQPQEPRRRPCPPSCRLPRLGHRSQPYLQGHRRPRPDGRRDRHHPEPRSRQGRSRAQYARRRGAIPGPKYSLVTVKNTVKVHKVKQAGAGISSNPQKASGRNPQKASARTK